MGAEHCPRCDRPYTAGEVTGTAILKPRPAALGGPWLEFACPGCRYLLRLLPHGNGRYAIPGEPPPPVPSDAERTVPWRRESAAVDAGSTIDPPRAAPPPPPTPPPPPPPRPPPAAPPVKPPPPPVVSSPFGPDVPLTKETARDALGVGPTDGPAAVEEAFRRRALLCHPDKVAHLDADFQALAASKFRRLQAARDLLIS